MMSRRLLLTLTFMARLLVGVVSGADSTSRGEWTQWRGPDRTGKSPDTGLLKDWTTQQPKLLWTSEGMGGGYASVSIAEGRIYTTGNVADGQAVICADAANGKVLWRQNITNVVPKHGHDGSRCTPSIDGNRLYAISSDGKLACLKTDGSLIWSKDYRTTYSAKLPSWGFAESPLVDGDLVLCTPGSAQATIVALNKLTGDEIWRALIPTLGDAGRDEAGYSSIVISNACGVKQYVQLVGKGVIGVRAKDGKFLWGYNGVANRTANISTPIVSGDYIFCSTGYGTGSALLQLSKSGDGIQCQEKYFLDGKTAQSHHGQMIHKDGYVYFGHGHRNGLPICVEMATGKVAWGGNERGPGSNSAAITYADGHLIFRYESGELALIEATPTAYRLKGTFKPEYISRNPCWSHPVITAGRLYLRDQDKLMCYDMRAK